MASTRFPGKVLADVHGTPLIGRVFERLSHSLHVRACVLATSTSQGDDVLVAYAEKWPNLVVYRGNEADVLGRYHAAAATFGLEIIVRATGDNPLLDASLVDKLVEELLNDPVQDYAASQGFPLGMGAEVLRFRALDRAYKEAVAPFDREHVTSYIWRRPEAFHLRFVEATGWLRRPDIRVTVDTPEDLEVVRAVLSHLGAGEWGVADVVRVMDAHPEISKINVHVRQRALGDT